jgi:hypothetical protein
MTPECQRWRDRRDSYRPAGEVIATQDYAVASLPSDAVAKAFVRQHHYSGTYPAARTRVGLYRHEALVGVAVFSVPCNAKALTLVFPGDPRDSVELGRFVLLDDVPANGETWFLARCFELLRRDGYRGVVSFSDPTPRTDRAGRVVFPGHLGTIYQAHNAQYLGRGTARTLRLLPDGSVMSARSIQKIRSGERGWRYSAALLSGAGAGAPPTGDRGAWLCASLARVTRRLAHPGNHRYAWPLRRGVQLGMTPGRYPKPGRAALLDQPIASQVS